MFLAIENNDKEIVNLLLCNSSIDVNDKNIYRHHDDLKIEYTTLLHDTILTNNNNIIADIINHPKNDVNIKSFIKKRKNDAIIEKELPTIYYTIKANNFESIKSLLLKNDFIINSNLIKRFISSSSFYIEEKLHCNWPYHQIISKYLFFY